MTESAHTNKSNSFSVPLVLLATIAVVGALKASYSVTMPLAFALFIIVLAWPLYRWMQARLSEKVAFGATLLLLLAVFGLFVGSVLYSGKVIGDAAPRYAQDAREVWEKTRQRAAQYDVRLPENPRQMLHGGAPSVSKSATLVRSALSLVGLWLLVFGLVVLGLHEAPRFRQRLKHTLDGDSEKGQTLEIIEQIIQKCGLYFWIRTVVSVIQGICSGLAALALGLDLPFIWGLSAALLNYIPTVGSLISVIPPTLFALFQWQDAGRAGLVFLVMCAIQVVLGTFVDPLLEGRQLKISAFLVLFSIAFWGWVWGIAGALIGVPLTVTILIVCAHFENTKWIADLFADNEPSKDAG